MYVFSTTLREMRRRKEVKTLKDKTLSPKDFTALFRSQTYTLQKQEAKNEVTQQKRHLHRSAWDSEMPPPQECLQLSELGEEQPLVGTMKSFWKALDWTVHPWRPGDTNMSTSKSF